jgi:hypothetical protein
MVENGGSTVSCSTQELYCGDGDYVILGIMPAIV